jgi:uncharacterized protein (DUF885 family)
VEVAQEIDNLRAGVRSGYSAPKVNVRRVIEQVETMLPGGVRASPLYSPARRDSSARFAAQWAAVLREHAYPALTRYRDYLANEYVAGAREASGLGALPAGEACYRAMVRANTSVDVAPEELARIGAAERARVDSQLRPLLDSLAGGRSGVDAKRYLRTAPELRFTSRDEMLAHARDNLQRARAAMPKLFLRIPTTPLVVEPTPAYRERSDAPARYQQPDTAGRPGVFVLNTYQPETRPRLDDGIGAFHEGVPGHHFQASYATERESAHPVTQRIGTAAFMEGWAFYAERLAAEVGLYGGPLQRAGYLLHQIDGWTALQVDPGLHVGGWSRRQAVDTIALATGKSEEVAASYADRHAATPGQLVSYMVGYRWIARLRADAEHALGDQFDLRAFHDVVLADGPVTLTMLETKVKRWVAEQQAAAARARSVKEQGAKAGR